MSRTLRLWLAARNPLLWLLPVTVVAALMSAMVLTSRSFVPDWVNDMWLVWEQSLNIKALGHPSYFLQANIGVFQPQFLMYGGTLFGAAGYLTVMLGEHPLLAYLLIFGASAVTAYVGSWWLASQIGLRGWLAHVPAVLFVTSSYYVTNLYGRGEFGETAATSMIPMTAAAGLWLARAPRWRPVPLVAFVVSIVFLTGSHAITLVWGPTYLIALALLAFWAVTGFRGLRSRRTLAICGVAVLAVAVNAWSLIPTELYHNRMLISTGLYLGQLGYTAPGALFALARDTVTQPGVSGAAIQAQLPMLAIAWSAIALVCLRRHRTPVTQRMVIGFGALLVVFVLLVSLPTTLINPLPSPWDSLQFPYRLVTYATLASCGLVGTALWLLQHTVGRERLVLGTAVGLVCAASCVAAVVQIWSVPSFTYKNRDRAIGSPGVVPKTYYPGVDYTDISAAIVQPSITSIDAGTPLKSASELQFPASPIRGSVSLAVKVPARGTVATNIATGTYMVKLQGAVPAGRTAWAPGGALGQSFMVVRLTGRPGTIDHVTVTTAQSPVLRLSLWLSCVAALCACLLFLLVWRAGRSGALSRWSGMIGEPLI